MNYKEKYEKAVQAAILAKQNTESAVTIQIFEDIFPELAESEDEKIRRNIIAALKGEGYYDCDLTNECIAWLEKQGGTKDKLNTMLDNSLSRETKESWNKFLDEQKSVWTEKDEIALVDALWCCKQAASIAKDENDMGNVWYAERWLESIKDRIKG